MGWGIVCYSIFGKEMCAHYLLYFERNDFGYFEHAQYSLLLKLGILGTSLVVQWLRLHASNAGGMGLTPGRGTKITHAVWHGQKKKKKKN